MGRKDSGYDTQQFDDAPDFEQYEENCAAAHRAFKDGVEDIEGVIQEHDPQTGWEPYPAGYGAVLSGELDYNPACGPGTRRRE